LSVPTPIATLSPKIRIQKPTASFQAVRTQADEFHDHDEQRQALVRTRKRQW